MVLGGNHFNESQTILNIGPKGFINFFHHHEPLVVFLHTLVFLLTQLDEISLGIPQCENCHLSATLDEVHVLENLVEFDEVSFIIGDLESSVLGEARLDVLDALYVVDGIHVLEFSIDVFCH